MFYDKIASLSINWQVANVVHFSIWCDRERYKSKNPDFPVSQYSGPSLLSLLSLNGSWFEQLLFSGRGLCTFNTVLSQFAADILSYFFFPRRASYFTILVWLAVKHSQAALIIVFYEVFTVFQVSFNCFNNALSWLLKLCSIVKICGSTGFLKNRSQCKRRTDPRNPSSNLLLKSYI